MLLSEIRSSIINTAKGGGIPSDDTRLSGRLIDFWIRYHRAAIIAEATNFGKDYYPDLAQDLGCLTLGDIDKGECPDVAWGCKIKKVEIPSLLDLPNERALLYVGLIDKQSPFEVIMAEQAGLMKYRLITSSKMRAYRIGNILYVMSPENKRIKYINVRGIFEKPEEVTKLDMAGATTVFDDSSDNYPIPDRLVPKLIENILSKELMLAINVSEDEMNDARDNIMATASTAAPKRNVRQRSRAR